MWYKGLSILILFNYTERYFDFKGTYLYMKKKLLLVLLTNLKYHR